MQTHRLSAKFALLFAMAILMGDLAQGFTEYCCVTSFGLDSMSGTLSRGSSGWVWSGSFVYAFNCQETDGENSCRCCIKIQYKDFTANTVHQDFFNGFYGLCNSTGNNATVSMTWGPLALGHTYSITARVSPTLPISPGVFSCDFDIELSTYVLFQVPDHYPPPGGGD